ncbi:MAG: UMP kinase [Candidatus Methanoplasma sp.]|jgi:uridylate kinase|nr:UMP kinase [Candidatus Methanoplasma sp.]
MKKEKVVVSIGGSILIPGKDDPVYIKKLTEAIKEVSKTVQVVIVCGGGRIARYYTETGAVLGGTTYQLDMLGIGATRLNAQLLAVSLGDLSSADIPTTAAEASARSTPDNIVIMGGTVPGHTTDAVAMMVAREMRADRVVNATSVEAVFSDDPKKDPAAERFSEMSIDELGDIVYKEHGAGKSSVFDPLGIKIAKEEKIDILMIDGRNLSELKNAVLGKEIKGTYVSSR